MGPNDRPFQTWCSVECGIRVAIERQEAAKRRKRERALKQFRDETRRRRKALKTPTEWASEAQVAFNGYIRERDRGLPCISCGKPDDGTHQRHASHFRSVKAAKQLRYNCWNVSASCAQCNTYESGSIATYRPALIDKIGLHRVEALENNNALCTHTIEYHQRVKRIFTKRTKHLKKLRAGHAPTQ